MTPIFPPRPKSRIDRQELPYYERTRRWVVQPKYHGSRNLVHISPEGVVRFFSRHGGPHLRFTPSADLIRQVLSLPGLESDKEYWLDSELLNRTTTEATDDKVVLFDVLQAGRYLFGKPPQMERLAMLDYICGSPKRREPGRGIALAVSADLWLAEWFSDDFVGRFDLDLGEEVEGLLLRRKDFALNNFGSKPWVTGMMIRCRRRSKNYSH